MVSPDTATPALGNTGQVEVVEMVVDRFTYTINEKGKRRGAPTPVASRSQLPLRLAWALTIHGAQGMTVSPLEVELGDTFVPGHSYVAVSRGVSPDMIRVVNYSRRTFMPNYNALEFDHMYLGGPPPPPDRRRALFGEGGLFFDSSSPKTSAAAIATRRTKKEETPEVSDFLAALRAGGSQVSAKFQSKDDEEEEDDDDDDEEIVDNVRIPAASSSSRDVPPRRGETCDLD